MVAPSGLANLYLYAEIRGTATLAEGTGWAVAVRIAEEYLGPGADKEYEETSDGAVRVFVRITPSMVLGNAARTGAGPIWRVAAVAGGPPFGEAARRDAAALRCRTFGWSQIEPEAVTRLRRGSPGAVDPDTSRTRPGRQPPRCFRDLGLSGSSKSAPGAADRPGRARRPIVIKCVVSGI
ncbi:MULTISPECIES: hypothetical protein [unclassified Streptomyces]|uniref:hypothetical protein n=1 Tax=unclassified Streptomyces TaxID=2593676 RepID=UPI001BE55FA1|nr:MULTISPECIES: hypothetical protein [unclassified Streptomyces]MBT2407532.1 hypothetical protein [Streptomyces sp. ISL-21]MBT2608129.1 hypothetical protein [Streptomyces sp. ISL-87]